MARRICVPQLEGFPLKSVGYGTKTIPTLQVRAAKTKSQPSPHFPQEQTELEMTDICLFEFKFVSFCYGQETWGDQFISVDVCCVVCQTWCWALGIPR